MFSPMILAMALPQFPDPTNRTRSRPEDPGKRISHVAVTHCMHARTTSLFFVHVRSCNSTHAHKGTSSCYSCICTDRGEHRHLHFHACIQGGWTPQHHHPSNACFLLTHSHARARDGIHNVAHTARQPRMNPRGHSTSVVFFCLFIFRTGHQPALAPTPLPSSWSLSTLGLLVLEASTL